MTSTQDLKLLGPLQSKIMIAVWGREMCVAKQVHEELMRSYKQDVKYTTVISTLNTLVKKGFLTKKKSSPAHEFQACLALQDYQRYMMKEICAAFYSDDQLALHADLQRLCQQSQKK